MRACPDCQRKLTEHEQTCVCGWGVAKVGQVWVIQHCTRPGCQVAIRVAAGSQEAQPVCKWHARGVAYNDPPSWPPGMPDPACPWPWLTDEERDRRLRLPFWRARLLQHADQYGQWLEKKLAGPAQTETEGIPR